jgi:organic radical activating enzyme
MSNLIVSDKVDDVSPSFCLAKWNMVSLHLTNGKTHSCYHNPTHDIPLPDLEKNPAVLHNTNQKLKERKQMRNGERPAGCSYCWKVEDLGHKSDRHYRADEWWNREDFESIRDNVELDSTITPAYIEVNFNQACNFKCMYCSPHLSTSWEEEIKEHGAYIFSDGSQHNNIQALERLNLMPKKLAQKENPYVQAFWKWWPEIYNNLKIFRMTGGEPLMDKNTFKVLDYAFERPNSDLEISITSNMCPPKQELFDKFIDKIKKIETIKVWNDDTKVNKNTGNHFFVSPSIKHLTLYISCDTVGEQAEYLRTGLDFQRMQNNTVKFLDESYNSNISIINTFNILSIPKLKEFLEWVLFLRERYSYENQKTVILPVPDREGFKHPNFTKPKNPRIFFDTPILSSPDWFNIKLGSEFEFFRSKMLECIEFMEENLTMGNYTGFEQYEIDKVKRNYDHMMEHMDDDRRKRCKRNFITFIDERDRRRNSNFIEVFPELEFFYKALKDD